MGVEEISIPTTEIEADGFITPPSALEYKNKTIPTSTTAKPASECVYPKCEECDKYHGHYCTVPIVVSKQDWLSMHDWAQKTTNRICDLENLVTEQILGAEWERKLP